MYIPRTPLQAEQAYLRALDVHKRLKTPSTRARYLAAAQRWVEIVTRPSNVRTV